MAFFIITQRFRDGSTELFMGSQIQRHRKTIAIMTKNGVIEVPKKGATLITDLKMRIETSRDGETH